MFLAVALSKDVTILFGDISVDFMHTVYVDFLRVSARTTTRFGVSSEP